MTRINTEDLLTEIKGSVLYLTLNRPERLNAFSPDMIKAMKQALSEAKDDASIRVIVIKGAGRAFSAGGDVKRMGNRSPLETYVHLSHLNELIMLMSQLEKPIIAAVRGAAAGAGFNLALAADIILASEESQFILSFSKVGLISDGGGLFFLPRLIGPYLAKELFFTADPITAEKAHSLGIVNHVYVPSEFEEKTEEFANKIASGPSAVYGFMKKMANLSLTSNLAEILEQERIIQASLITTSDHQEGVQAFKEKRPPQFGKEY